MYRNILCICVPYLDTDANNHQKTSQKNMINQLRN